MSELPSNYKKGVERVSNIVSFRHPFKWTDWEKRYKNWLAEKWIEESVYLEMAQIMWTYVHDSLEHFILKNRKRKVTKAFADCEKEIDHWITWLKELDYQEIFTEKYVLEENDRFQWAVDLLYKKDDEWVLADWKTFGICKKRFDLPNKPTVPKSKKDKVLLQMSLYCYALKQEWILVDSIELLFLHEEWIKVFAFEPLSDTIIEELLEEWETKEYLF